MTTGLAKYDLAAKHAFRRWAWKQLSRTGRSGARAGHFFYLIGPAAADWRVAHDYGIGRDRLIGVDTNAEHVATARAAGLYAIMGDLAEVLRHWRLPVAGVLADLCCNFQYRQLGQLWMAVFGNGMLTGQPFPFVVNMQRGRETGFDWQCVQEAEVAAGTRTEPLYPILAKLRGQPVEPRAQPLAALVKKCQCPPRQFAFLRSMAAILHHNCSEEQRQSFLETYLELSRYYTYKSRQVMMDSIAVPCLGTGTRHAVTPPSPSATGRRVAALKATITRARRVVHG